MICHLSGRNFILDKKFGSPTITKDGVTVAKEIELEDPYENMGVQLVREVASKTSDIAGDGTTTATVLAESIYKEGLRNVTAGANPTSLQRGITRRSKRSSLTSRTSRRRSVTARKLRRLPPSRLTGIARSARSLPTPWIKLARMGRLRWRKPSRSKPASTLSKACSSTKATFLHISSRTRKRWKPSWRTLHPHPREEDLELEGHAAAA